MRFAIRVLLLVAATLAAAVCLKAQFVQQAKIVAPDTIGLNPAQGNSVAISADGNTMIIGGVQDNGHAGAVWVYVRNGATWTEQAKLVASGEGVASLGSSLALSADGNTAALVGLTMPSPAPTERFSFTPARVTAGASKQNLSVPCP